MNFMKITSEDMLNRAKVFTREYIMPISSEVDKNNRCPIELIEPMALEGFFKIQYPKKYGGYGLDCKTAFDLVCEISKGSPGIGLLYVVHWMATDVLMKYGSEVQKEKYLHDLVTGNKIAAYSISEPSAGSDAASIETIAKKVESGWIINGSKYFVTNGEIADIYIVACKTSPEKGAKGISLFIIEKDTEGLSITYHADKMGFRSSSTSNLVLNDCFVADEELIGEEGKGFKFALDGLVGGRLGMVAIGIGIGEIALNEAIKFSNNRKAFGNKINSLYAIQAKIADMYIKLEGAKGLYSKTCEKRACGHDYSIESSVAKVATAKSVNEICYEAIQIMGGHGYIKNNRVERYYRDGRLLDIGVGTSEVLKMVIGSTILKR